MKARPSGNAHGVVVDRLCHALPVAGAVRGHITRKLVITAWTYKLRYATSACDYASEGERIDPRGLGTQLYSAASPNQVIKINASHAEPQDFLSLSLLQTYI